MGLPILWLAAAAIPAIFTGSNGLAATMLPTALRDTGPPDALGGLRDEHPRPHVGMARDPFRIPGPPRLRVGADPAARGPDLSRGLQLRRVPRLHRPHPAGSPRPQRRDHPQRLLVPQHQDRWRRSGRAEPRPLPLRLRRLPCLLPDALEHRRPRGAGDGGERPRAPSSASPCRSPGRRSSSAPRWR